MEIDKRRKNTMPSEEAPTEPGPQSLTRGARRLIANNFDRGKNPGRNEKERVVPVEFAEVLRDHVSVLPEEIRTGKVAAMHLGVVFTPESLVDELLADSLLGRDHFEGELGSAREVLKEKGNDNPSNDELIQEVINSYKEATRQIREEEDTRT